MTLMTKTTKMTKAMRFIGPRSLASVAAGAALALTLTGCAQERGPQPTPGQGGGNLATDSAALVAGDVVPHRLVATRLPERVATPTAFGSDPAPLRATYVAERPSLRKSSRELVRVVQPGALPEALALDAPTGARVIVSAALAPGRSELLAGVHLRLDPTGDVIDGGRDVDPARMLGKERPTRHGITGNPLPEGDLVAALKDEPGLARAALPTRLLSVERLALPGSVLIDVPSEVRSAGYLVIVQQPGTTIEAGAQVNADLLALGDSAELTVDLADAGQPIDGAIVSAWIERPSRTELRGVTFAAAGSGRYLARLPLTSVDAADVGVWTVHAEARGKTSAGVAFERTVDTSFGYSIPHARMTTVAQPRVVRQGGEVVEIQVDVEVSSVAADRLGLMGTLVVRGADGVEHPVAEAQTGQDVGPGQAVITLHFSGEALAIASADGPYLLRELALVSQSSATTLHRLGRALDVSTERVEARTLRAARQLPVGWEEAIDLGQL